jgi:hypothetical protein
MSKAIVPLVETRVEGPHGGKPIKQWTCNEVCEWVTMVGFQDCTQVFQAHLVTGPALPRLNPSLLAEMGIASVGRRMLLMSEITKLQAVDRAHWRAEVLWQGEEYRAGPCNGVLPYGFPYCCECETGKPAFYKLTNSKFTNVQFVKNCNYPGCGIMGYSMTHDTVDLFEFKDVDLAASTAMVGDPPGTITIQLKNGTQHSVTLQSSQCAKVNAIMTNAKEEAIIQQGLMQFGRA